MPAARDHFQRAVEFFDAGQSGDYSAYLVQNAPNILVGALLRLGYPLTALRRGQELLTAARRTSDPRSLAVALNSYGLHHVVLRDTEGVGERADELLSIATEHEMRLFLLPGAFFRGWAIAAAGRGEEGLAEMRRSISDPLVAELISTALMLVALAETYGKNGRAKEGLELVARGLATAEQTGLRLTEAELHRSKVSC